MVQAASFNSRGPSRSGLVLANASLWTSTSSSFFVFDSRIFFSARIFSRLASSMTDHSIASPRQDALSQSPICHRFQCAPLQLVGLILSRCQRLPESQPAHARLRGVPMIDPTFDHNRLDVYRLATGYRADELRFQSRQRAMLWMSIMSAALLGTSAIKGKSINGFRLQIKAY